MDGKNNPVGMEIIYKVNMIREVSDFNRIRRDWLGEGGEPVAPELSQARADVCTGRLTGKRCPSNYQGSWLYNIVTSIVINSQMKLRRILNLKVEGEDTLRTCEICGCKLALKIHVPFRHLYRHTTPEQFSKFPDFCWLQKELKAFHENNPTY